LVNPPNIALILVDNAGLIDFGAFGGEAQTPNLDRLAKNGIMFTNMHASPVCAPSRAMLMTGSDSHLTGVPNLPEMLPKAYQEVEGYEGVLNDRVQTIATRLKEQNYNTYVTGKWHLGYDQYTLPNKRGFDRSFILSGSGADNYEAAVYLPFKSKAQWFADGQEADLPEDFYSSAFYVDQMIRFHEEETDPAETDDISVQNPMMFQIMLSKYETYAKEVGVLVMPKSYDAQSEVAKKSTRAVLNPFKN
jgi:arylsulfatase A-like enzyme